MQTVLKKVKQTAKQNKYILDNEITSKTFFKVYSKKGGLVPPSWFIPNHQAISFTREI